MSLRYLCEGLDGGVLGRAVLDNDLNSRLAGILQHSGIVKRASYRTSVCRHESNQLPQQVRIPNRYFAFWAMHHGDHLLFGHAKKEMMICSCQSLGFISQKRNSKLRQSGRKDISIGNVLSTLCNVRSVFG